MKKSAPLAPPGLLTGASASWATHSGLPFPNRRAAHEARRHPLRLILSCSLLSLMFMAPSLLAQTQSSGELKQEAILRAVSVGGYNYERGVNLSSVRGVPLSNEVNSPAGSDGRAPASPPATANQFQSAVFFSGVTVQGAANSPGSATTLEGAAKILNWPRLEVDNAVVAVLRAQVGAPYFAQQVSFYFGAEIPRPSTDEDGTLLTGEAPEDYWFAEPHSADNHATARYYYSPNAQKVFAIQPGAVTITWKKVTPSATEPADYNETNYSLESGFYYTLYEQTYTVSGAAIKTPQKMYWTEGVFQTGKPVTVPNARVGGIKVVYNSTFPERVAEEYTAQGQSEMADSDDRLQELRTLWYDHQQGQIKAYNAEGRVFVEILGDLKSDGESREHLGFEIVDVSKQATPVDLTTELGEILYPTRAKGTLGLAAKPIGNDFLYRHDRAGQDTAYYAAQLTENLNDVLVRWLVSAEAGLQWPYLLGRYQFHWPDDVEKYSHYLRPLVASEAEAKLTAVPLPAENVPWIEYQDPLDQPRAKLTEQQAFYTFLEPAYPAHRTLLRFTSGEEVAFERVFSWLESSLMALQTGAVGTPTLLSETRDGENGLNLLNGAEAVHVAGDVAYVASLVDDSLTLVDVSDPVNPRQLSVARHNAAGAFNKLDGPSSVVVSGNYAYVTASGSGSLTIINVSVPAAPKWTSHVYDGLATGVGANTYRLANASSVFLSGTLAYVAAHGALTIIDVSDPAAPQFVGEVVSGDTDEFGANAARLGGASSVYVENGFAYVVTQATTGAQKGLTVIDVSTPSAPKVRKVVTDNTEGMRFDRARTILVSGTTAFVTSSTQNTVSIIDISDPSNPQKLNVIINDTTVNGHYYDTLLDAWGLALSGNVLMVGANGAVTFLDVSDPAAPVYLSHVTNGVDGFSLLAGSRGVFMLGERAYVTANPSGSGNDGLTILNLRPLLAPAAGDLANSVANELSAYEASTRTFDRWAVDTIAPRVVQETVRVGERLSPPAGEALADENGILPGHINLGTFYSTSAYIDPLSAGFEAARRGAIIPVNAIPGSNELQVWWFRKNGAAAEKGFGGIYWPAVIGAYTLEWPSATDEIVLASNEGSGRLSAAEAQGGIYVQNNPALPGYNPNEEHALMLDDRIYAIRDDLNITTGDNYSSEPYVLLEYTAADGRPAMRPFEVLRERSAEGIAFDYVVEAGQQIQPPMPLTVLPLPLDENGVNHNHEVADSSADLPVNWETSDADGLFGHYEHFTRPDRKNTLWVYRGLHAGLPALQMGRFDGTAFVNPADATAAVDTEFSYTIHASRRSDSLVMKVGVAGAPLPEGLSIDGLTISGVPTTAAGLVSVALRVFDTSDGSSAAKFLKITVAASGSVVTQGPLAITSLNAYSGESVTHTGRPPHLADAPVDTNAFTMRFYYPTLDGFAWPGIETPPPTGSIVPYLRAKDGDGGYLGEPDSPETESLQIVYRPVWPANPPTMSYGETLTAAKNGLPGVRGQSSVQILYQQSIGMNITAANPAVVLHDPTREKTRNLAKVPAGVLTDRYQGLVFFPSLPPHLVERFYFDPNRGASGQLVLRGAFVDETLGEDYLLLNVLSDSDLETVKALCPDGDANKSSWDSAVGGLGATVETFVENPSIPGQYIVGTSATVDGESVVEINDDDTAVDSYALSASGPGAGYVTLVVGDGEAFTDPGEPVSVYVLRVDPALYTGELKIVASANPLNELISFQHTADLGGRTADYEYEWRIGPPVGGLVPTVPGGFSPLTSPTAVADLPRYILGGNTSGLLLLSDNYVIMRYRPVHPDHPLQNQWSDWTTPQLAEGWIKRVLAGINPFNQRVSDLFDNGVNTTVSLIAQAGQRWEGDVALNQDTINNYGLIEIYETVLKRGRNLSIDGGYNYGPANDALLLAAGYLNDLYMMLGNEAWADAANPTIGIGSKDQTFGEIATALFAFKGQVSSLLEEELALLRGRDDFLQPGVELTPVYNRLVWNYTRGIDSGEVIYALNYNISEDTGDGGDGVVNAEDAAALFPQGHGDAYGHYLTALKGYWALLMNENFDWVPRTEAVTVLGQPVQIDYFDERKFAAAAAAVARTGRQVFDLTWRKDYQAGEDVGWEHLAESRENPQRTYEQGAASTGTTRYWGADHWAARTVQGAYLNWVMGNAILPEEDTDPTHEGILKIDRTTVPELAELAVVADELQTGLDNAEGGLTPLGLPAGALAFDINPQSVTGSNPQTHFEQVYQRGKTALSNALAAFDDAKDVTRLMRSGEVSLSELQATVNAQELAYTNALVELYGTPYPDDIGVGKTYPQGYAGPDLLHYSYVDLPESDFGGLLEPQSKQTFNVDVQQFPADWLSTLYTNASFITSSTDAAYANGTHHVEFNIGPHGYFSKPSKWTSRRASPGRIQQAISEYIAAHSALKQAVTTAELEKQQLDKAIQLATAQAATSATLSGLGDAILDLQEDISHLEATYNVQNKWFQRSIESLELFQNVAFEAMPKSFIAGTASGGDLTSGARAAILAAYAAGTIALSTADSVQYQLTINKVRDHQNDIAAAYKAISALQVEQDLKNAVYDLGLALSDVQSHLYTINEKFRALDDAGRKARALVAEGDRIQQERLMFRQRTAAIIQGYRTRDAAFRVFRNEKLERYKTLFDLAARYTYLAATAYDYETGLLHTSAGQTFLNRIINSRALGVMRAGEPQYAGSNTGDPGLSSVLAEMKADWDVLKGRLGFNNADGYGTTVSLRTENLRILPGTEGDSTWQDYLEAARTDNLLEDADVRRYCMQIDDGSGLPVPGIIIEFSTTIATGYNLFGRPLAAGDHAYTPSSFATKLFAAGIALEGYRGMDNPAANSGAVSAGGGTSPSDPSSWFLDPLALAATPYVYFIPVGADSMRSPPLGDVSTIRTWNVQDVTIPLPFNIGDSNFSTKQLWQSSQSLSEPLFNLRKHQAFRPVSTATVFAGDIYGSTGQIATSQYTNRRLIGRSAWNSKWKLVIPGNALLNDADEGLERFIQTVTDVKLHLVTYSYAGN